MLHRFDFSGIIPLALHRHVEKTVEAVADGRCDAVLMWWELEMDDSAQLILSTAPYWAHTMPDSMQVIFHTAPYGAHGELDGLQCIWGLTAISKRVCCSLVSDIDT